jgi:hypothetical protein
MPQPSQTDAAIKVVVNDGFAFNPSFAGTIIRGDARWFGAASQVSVALHIPTSR